MVPTSSHECAQPSAFSEDCTLQPHTFVGNFDPSSIPLILKENGYFGLSGAKIFFACGALKRGVRCARPAAGTPPL